MTDVLKDASVKPREIKGYGWKPSLPDLRDHIADASELPVLDEVDPRDRKSTRLNSSHLVISYAVFCLKKKKRHTDRLTRATSRRILPLSQNHACRLSTPATSPSSGRPTRPRYPDPLTPATSIFTATST